jgi:hypothetical protein
LRGIERLDLRRLVDRKDGGMRRQIDMAANGHAAWRRTADPQQLELAHPMRFAAHACDRCVAPSWALMPTALAVMSRASPAIPSVWSRSPPTPHTGATHDLRMPQPSAVARMIRARQTCFCGLLRSATIAAKRARSAPLT